MRAVRATADTFRFRERVYDWLATEDRCAQPNEAAPYSFLLVYPNEYAVGLSNLGFQTVYRLVNEEPGWACERSLLYPSPWGAQLRSVESLRRGSSFHVVGFSCSYELDYPTVVAQIASTGIPLRAAEREEGQPIFILGGAVTFFNPVPLAPFFDVVVLGEVEPVLHDLLDSIARRWGRTSRRTLLEALADLPGVWCPPLEPLPSRKIRLSWRGEEASPEYSCIISRGTHMDQAFLVEIGRGCGRRCRFCVASHVYYPFRLWPKKQILDTIDARNRKRYRVGLVGAAVSDYPELRELLGDLLERGLSFSLSSLRIDGLDADLVALLERGGVRSVTLAPETASTRLQRVIHKNLRLERMLEAADLLARSQVQRVKLYFLIGLPWETDEDVEQTAHFIVEFARRLSEGPSAKRLTASVNAFVPKPHTPFQWCGMAPREVLDHRKKILRRIVGGARNVELEFGSRAEEYLQAVFSLGGSELAGALESSVQEGIPLKIAVERAGVDARKLIHGEKPADAPFPWDFIAGGPSRSDLLRQLHLARSEAGERGGLPGAVPLHPSCGAGPATSQGSEEEQVKSSPARRAGESS